MGRIKVVGLAVLSVLAIGMVAAGGASASIQCSKLKGAVGGTVTASKCTPSAGKGYKTLSGSAESLTGGSFTWSNSGATTEVAVSRIGEAGPCPMHGIGILYGGLVTGASTFGEGIPALGDAYSVAICISMKHKISLVKGSHLDL